MSQFTLTPEEDAIITDALKAKAAQYAAMFGVTDPALEALIAKLDSYNPEPAAVVVEEAPVVEADPVAEEKPAKTKKVKAEDEAE
jgi:hypothetical protein